MTGSTPSEGARPPEVRHTFRERIEARLVGWVCGALGWLPLGWVSGLGAGFGWFVFRATGLSRRQVLYNLEVAFGDTLAPERRWAIAARCYRLFGALLCEFLALPRVGRARMPEHIVLENLPVLAAALAQGKGVVLVSSHFGSWELVGPGLVAAGYPVTIYTGGQRNTLVDGQINAIRASTGQTTVGRTSGGVRGLLRALRGGQIVALAADQHESTKRHFVSCFGHPVSIVAGPYQLARRSGAPVLYATTVREGRFRYRTVFEALPAPRPEAEEERDLLEFAQRMFDKLERDVRAHPDHYFWMHRRFRQIPHDVTLTPVNLAFLEGRLRRPLASYFGPLPGERER